MNIKDYILTNTGTIIVTLLDGLQKKLEVYHISNAGILCNDFTFIAFDRI